MNNKKNIDRLFQEKFKDFEASPNKRVWKNIEQELKKGNKKKVVPLFWYKAAGIAASLTLLLFLANSLFQPHQVSVVDANKEKKSIKENTSNSPKPITEEVPKNNRVFSSNEDASNTENHLAGSPTQKLSTEAKKNIENKNLKNKSDNIIKTPRVIENNNINIVQNNNASAEAKTHAENTKESYKNKSQSQPTKSQVTDKESNKLIANHINKDSTLTGSTLKEDNALAQREKELNEENNNDNKQEEETKNFARWNIRPNVSPVYYGNLSDSGSPIDPQFSNNDASGEVSMAYGVNFAYAVSKKIKVRTGVSRVQLNYSTNDIAFTSSIDPIPLDGVSSNVKTKSIQVLNSRPSAITTNSSLQDRDINPYTDGSLKQQVGFIEIPLEIEYAILDRRFGIHLIGGASSLILNNNEIAVSSAEGVTNIGKANNLNSVSFSTNVGVGLGYEISKKIDFNVEPTFKYQINTFTGNTNGFKPYYFGVYTGLNFKF